MMIIVTVFAMFSLTSEAQEKFSLSYKLEKGKTYKYIQDNIIETTQEMGGQEMKMNTDGHSILKYEVEDVNKDGLITLIYSYEQAKYRMKGMGRDTTMDLKNMMDKKTRAEVAKNGKIIKESLNDTTKGSKSLMSMNMFANANLAILPDQPVGLGESWPRVSSDTTSVEGSQMVYKKNINYTLTAREKKGNFDCLKVDFKGTLEITGKMKQMNMDLAIEGSGETSGTVWFDPASGMMIEEKSNTSIEMTMALTGQTQMSIPMTQNISTSQKIME